MNVGPDILGAWNMVPPPGYDGELNEDSEDETLGKLRFKPKKLLKKAGRGLKKAGKVAVKIHTAPLKLAAKAGTYAARKLATVAAIPIRRQFKTLATRRARLLSWQARKSLQPNTSEKKQAVVWSLAKMRSKGPIGKFGVKVLQFTRGATLGQLQSAAAMTEGTEVLGMTGAEIAAAAAAVVAAISGIMKSLNKPGEAPADPRQGDDQEAASDASEPDDAGPPPGEDDDSAGTALTVLGTLLAAAAGGPLGAASSLVLSAAARKKAKAQEARKERSSDEIEASYRERPLKKAYRNRPEYRDQAMGLLPVGARGYIPTTWIMPDKAEEMVRRAMEPRGIFKQRLSREDAEREVARYLKAKSIGIRTS